MSVIGLLKNKYGALFTASEGELKGSSNLPSTFYSSTVVVDKDIAKDVERFMKNVFVRVSSNLDKFNTYFIITANTGYRTLNSDSIELLKSFLEMLKSNKEKVYRKSLSIECLLESFKNSDTYWGVAKLVEAVSKGDALYMDDVADTEVFSIFKESLDSSGLLEKIKTSGLNDFKESLKSFLGASGIYPIVSFYSEGSKLSRVSSEKMGVYLSSVKGFLESITSDTEIIIGGKSYPKQDFSM